MNNHDWFADALAEYQALMKQFSRSQRSSEWSHGLGRRETPESFFERALRAARNVTRHQGVPTVTEVRLARMSEVGAGAAGFHDAPQTFYRPFILLDRGPYQLCQSTEVALDVYCGIALHEAGHILYTRDGYRRMSQPGRDRLLKSFDNLLEDDRIESLVCQESPGYAPYIIAARKVLLEQGNFGQAFREWDQLPDLDKVLALIMGYVRIPQMISAVAQSWKALNGDCVFATLRSSLSVRPRTEQDVEQAALWLFEYYQRLRAAYCHPEAPGDSNPDATSRRNRQSLADEEDFELQVLEELALGTAPSGEPEVIRSAEKNLDQSSRHPATPSRRRPGRFAARDLQASISVQSRVSVAFPDDFVEALEASRQSQSKATLLSEEPWKWDDSRRMVKVERAGDPDASARYRYALSLGRVKTLIPTMKAALPQVGRQRRETLRDQSTGTLDPRRIAVARVSGKIFKQQRQSERSGFTLGLLLDASGSMSDKAEVTRDAAVLLAEAFCGDNRVDFSVYSHTSAPDRAADCLVQVLYDSTQRARSAIGGYSAQSYNYDSCAIAKCDELLKKQSRRGDRRILVVISDGRPNGHNYEGPPAIAASRESVVQARKNGTQVIAIGIGGYRCNEIYGDRWVLNLHDCKDLPRGLRSLLICALRGS